MATNVYSVNGFRGWDVGGSIGEIVFQKATSPNMDKLWRTFYDKHRFPKKYLGKVERMALCKCPGSNKEEWINSNRLELPENLCEDTQIIQKRRMDGKIYIRDIIFLRWETDDFYEWELDDGNILQLRQDYVDGLLPEDKKKLGML